MHHMPKTLWQNAGKTLAKCWQRAEAMEHQAHAMRPIHWKDAGKTHKSFAICLC